MPGDRPGRHVLHGALLSPRYRWRDIPTGIGHDAVYMARKVPTVMIFAQSDPPLSHTKIEDSPEEALVRIRRFVSGVAAGAVAQQRS